MEGGAASGAGGAGEGGGDRGGEAREEWLEWLRCCSGRLRPMGWHAEKGWERRGGKDTIVLLHVPPPRREAPRGMNEARGLVCVFASVEGPEPEGEHEHPLSNLSPSSNPLRSVAWLCLPHSLLCPSLHCMALSHCISPFSSPSSGSPSPPSSPTLYSRDALPPTLSSLQHSPPSIAWLFLSPNVLTSSHSLPL